MSVRVSDEMERVRARAKRQLAMRQALTYLVAIVLSLWILLPIWLIASTALTTPEAMRHFPKGVLPFIPFSFDTMRFFLDSHGILPGLVNSVVVALMTLGLSTLIAAPAGYALSRYSFRGRETFRLSILAVRAFPVVILSIPLAFTFISLGIFDSIPSLALMHTALTLPTTVLVIGSVFAGIPYELEEAAQVFGCTPLQAFRTVIMPLALPGIAAAGLFTFVMSWNEVFAATVLTVKNRTLPAQVLVSLREASDAYKFAGGFFMLVPSVIFIVIIRKYLFNMWGQASK